MNFRQLNAILIASVLTLVTIHTTWAQTTLLNVSYDPTREFYTAYNVLFEKYYKAKTGKDVAVEQSHGGSGKQARAVIDGLQADVVTLGLAGDIDAIASKAGLIPADWQKKFPENSTPYTSTIVLLVHKGNPKAVKDWDDLAKPGIQVITPNPKSSGGARWNYLAAWAFAEKKLGKDDVKIKEFIGAIYKNVPVLDSGARGSTTTFISRGIGDVLISWENEAYQSQKEFPGQFEIVIPSISILAEPPVAVVEKVVEKKGTAEVAKSYLDYLYSEEAQDLVGQNFFRPRSAKAQAKYAAQFPKLELVTIDGAFGGWKTAQPKHFGDGGIFDQLYKPVNSPTK